MNKNTYYILYFILVYLCCIPGNAFAQKGKNGTVTINASGININEYTYLTSDAASGGTSISVNNLISLTAGDLILIIQMQGAQLSNANDSTWGSIVSYKNSGLYEFHEVISTGAGKINFSCPLQNSYSTTGHTQVVKVPRYSTLTIDNNAGITPPAWNGLFGGIVVAEVMGDININGSINVNGLGFRAGQVENATSTGCTAFASLNADGGAEKGESIAGSGSEYDIYGGRYGRGAPANGGGGGNCHNAGGGGGANASNPRFTTYTGNGNPDITNALWKKAWDLEYPGFSMSTSSGGGRGGCSWSYLNDRDATVVGPNNSLWGGDSRRNVGGKGGRSLDYSSGRIFFGGGGGAGDSNNDSGGEGGKGGGLVFLISCGQVSGSGNITANGSDGKNTTGSGIDAVGGGGGGGTIVIDAASGVNGITMIANGGRGGSQFITSIEAEGPGGGGSGGYISITSGTATRSASGGINGTTSSPIMNEFPSNSSTTGAAGIADAVFINPSSTVDANDTIVCKGSSATLFAKISGASQNKTISWYKNNNRNQPPIATGSLFTVPDVQSDTILYIGICSYNCSQALEPVTIKIKAPPTPNAGRDTAVCTGSQLTLGAPATPGYTYSWSPTTNLSNATISNPEYTAINGSGSSISTKYTLVATLDGCSANDDINVRVEPKPVANPGPPVKLCSGESFSIGAAAQPSYSYKWAGDLPLSPDTLSMYSLTGYNNLNTDKVLLFHLTVDVYGCKDTSSVKITIEPMPWVFAGKDTAVCSGNPVHLGSNGLPGPFSYSWTPSANLDNDTSPYPEFKAVNISPVPQLYSYILTTKQNNCESKDTVIVTVNPYPTANAGADITVCPGKSVLLGSPAIVGYHYKWSGDISLNPDTIAQPSLVFENSSLTAKDFNFTVENNFYGCKAFDGIKVTVNPGPIAYAGRDTSVCSNSFVQLGASGQPSVYSYLWSPPLGLSSSTISDPGFQEINNGLIPEIFKYELVASYMACSDTDEVVINVNPIPVPDAGPDAVICSDSTIFLGAPSIANYEYSWSPGNGLNNTAVANPSFKGFNPTLNTNVYQYTLSTSLFGCIRNDIVNVTVKPSPPANAGTDLTVCEKITTQLGVLPDANFKYRWTPDASLSSDTVANPLVSVTNQGTAVLSKKYTLSVYYNSCKTNDDITINLYPKINPQISNSVIICEGEKATLKAEGGVRYKWNTNDTSSTIVVSPEQTTLYHVQIENVCTAEDTVTVFVKAPDLTRVYIPNAFTPNKDKLLTNEVFKAEGQFVSNLHATIFNRWGEIIYEWIGLEGGWNGYVQGDLVQEDVYVYQIKVQGECGKSQTYNGTVSVIK